jgi:hypothetical protein
MIWPRFAQAFGITFVIQLALVGIAGLIGMSKINKGHAQQVAVRIFVAMLIVALLVGGCAGLGLRVAMGS